MDLVGDHHNSSITGMVIGDGIWVGTWVGITGDMGTTLMDMDIALMAMHTILTGTLDMLTTGIMVTITAEDGLYLILMEIEIQETEALQIGAETY